MSKKVTLVGLLLLNIQSVFASTVTQSTLRFGIGVDYGADYSAWYPGPSCGPYFDGPVTRWESSTDPSQVCDEEGRRQLQAVLSSTSADQKTQCYTYSAVVTTDGGCFGTCDPGYCIACEAGGCDPYLCTVTVSANPRANTTSYPVFIVHNLIYDLPGNKSTAYYYSGVSSGSTWSISTTYSTEISVGWQTPFANSTSGYKFSVTNQTQTSIKNDSTSGNLVSYSGDIVDHTRDLFTLWINPTMTEYIGCEQPVYVAWGAGGVAPWLDSNWFPASGPIPIMFDYTVAELLNPASIPWTDTYRKEFISRLDSKAIGNILAHDPFLTFDAGAGTWIVNDSPTLSVDRFRSPAGCGFFEATGSDPQEGKECKQSYSWTQDN